jgi:hypothetical protein
MLAAAFWLLSLIIIVELGESSLGVGGCFWLILSGREPVGTCSETGLLGQIREIMDGALTAVLALLLAARAPPPPPPPQE